MKKEIDILVIDDEKELYECFRAIYPDTTVLWAANGVEGLARLNAHSATIRLVILDYNMPVLNGLETLKTIKEEHPNLPVVMMSGNTAIKNDALKIGALTFLEKPFDLNTLKSVIEPIIRGEARENRKRKDVLYVCRNEKTAPILGYFFSTSLYLRYTRSKEDSFKELAKRNKPDLVLVEHDAPAMPITDYLAALGKKHPRIPVILTIADYTALHTLTKEVALSAFSSVIDVIEGPIINTDGIKKIFNALGAESLIL